MLDQNQSHSRRNAGKPRPASDLGRQPRRLRWRIVLFTAVSALCLLPYLGALAGSIAPGTLEPDFTIAGTLTEPNGTPIADALVRFVGSDGSNVITTSGSNGQYAALLTGGLTYTVTPTKTGFAFSPSNRVINLNATVTDANFTGTTGQQFSITGTITGSGAPLTDVLITISGNDGSQIFTTTGTNGVYAVTLTGGLNYTITPSKSGFSFNPPNRTFTPLNANQSGVDFAGSTGQAFNITGKAVQANGTPIPDVLISVASNDGSNSLTTTGADGIYTLVLTGGLNYTLTPSKSGFSFNPANRTFTPLTATQTGQDFVGSTGQLFTISGKVTTTGGAAIPDVLITATAADGSNILTTTGIDGNYSVLLTGGLSYTITPSKAGFFFNPPNRIFSNLNANHTNADFTQASQTPASVQFSTNTYTFDEGSNFGTITVIRSGDTTGAVTVKYATSDATDVNFNCNPATANQIVGAASRKCDYHIAAGRVRFGPGETSKQILLSLVNDVYVEGTESLTIRLTNPTGATLAGSDLATININDNDLAGGQPNPIDNTSFYVRMLYVDLLSREPDPAGLAGWVHRIDFCNQPGEPPPPCDRVTVGGDGFMRSAEFFDRQFFVIKLYRAGLGRILRYEDVGDLAYVSGFLTDADLESSKQELVAEIMSRTEFSTMYNGLSDASYVDLLIQTSAVTIPQNVRDGWVTSLGNSSKTRAQVYRELSERPEVSNRYLHEAQVVSCYYGFFTRNPDAAYLNFLDRLDRGEINLGDLANAFINASEYRQRFGP